MPPQVGFCAFSLLDPIQLLLMRNSSARPGWRCLLVRHAWLRGAEKALLPA